MFPDDIKARVRSILVQRHEDVSDELRSCRCHPRVRALRRLAEIARRHYGKYDDLDAALDAVEEAGG